MAKGFCAEQIIDAPVSAVWDMATDASRMPEWMPGIKSVTPDSDTPMSAGKRFSIVLETRGRGSQRQMTLSEWEPRMRFALSSQEGSVSAVYTYSFEPAGEGTRMVLSGTCMATGFFMKLLHPLIVHMMAKHDRPQVDLLKRLIETG